MKKVIFLIVLIATGFSIKAQNNMFFWCNGNLMFGNLLSQSDSITFGDGNEMDTLHLLLPRSSSIIVRDTIIVTIHDTIYSHDTLFYVTPEKVNLGLPSGLKWASCNVGATSINDYGFYVQWGCIQPIKCEGWEVYCFGKLDSITKYCLSPANGIVDNLSELTMEDDMAHQFLGGNWRMPTKEEAEELWNNCTKTWEVRGNVSGYRFTGPNGNSIFLPSNGWLDEQGGVHTLNEDGLYWTSTLYSPNSNGAWGLITRASVGNAGVLYGQTNRHFARAIRAVCE